MWKKRESVNSEKQKMNFIKNILSDDDLFTEWIKEAKNLKLKPKLVISEKNVLSEISRLSQIYLNLRLEQFINSLQENSKEKIPPLNSKKWSYFLGQVFLKVKENLFQYELKNISTKDTKIYPFQKLFDPIALEKEIIKSMDAVITQNQFSETLCCRNERFQCFVASEQGPRSTMEDTYVCIPYLNDMFGLVGFEEQSYFAVFDGHAGLKAAKFCMETFHLSLIQHKLFKSNLYKALIETFTNTDQSLLEDNFEQISSGCTCVVVFVRGKELYLGWLGDSQAMVSRNWMSIGNICVPHKPERPDEKKRIELAGGSVVHLGVWRVNGILSVSRAIGDKVLKKLIVSDADIYQTKLQGDEDFILLACDGFWDVFTEEEAVECIKHYLISSGNQIESVASELVAQALERGSSDNITIIIIFVNKNIKRSQENDEENRKV